MHSSAKLKSPLLSVLSFCSYNKIYHKHEVRIIFVFTTCRSESPLTIIIFINWIKID